MHQEVPPRPDSLVLAANSHGALVQALKGLLAIVSVVSYERERDHVCGITLGRVSDDALAAARAALALADGRHWPDYSDPPEQSLGPRVYDAAGRPATKPNA